jgi:hypothetical protein
VAAPCHVLGDPHAASVFTVHVPEVEQQAPIGTQGLGEQLVPAPCQVLGETHAACVVTVQVPAGAQQAPVG